MTLPRQAVWLGLEYWLRSGGRGFAVPLENLRSTGFRRKFAGGALQGLMTRNAGAWCAYTFDREGTFYPAVQLSGPPRSAAELAIDLDGREVARIRFGNSDGRSALYNLTVPVEFRPGRRLTMTCRRSVGVCRVEGLFFGNEPIRLPEVTAQNIEVWSERPGSAAICWTTPRMAETGVVEYGIGALNLRTVPSSYVGQNHRVVLDGLDPEETYQGRIVGQCEGRQVVSEPFHFRPRPPIPSATSAQAISRGPKGTVPFSLTRKLGQSPISLAVTETTDCARRDWPTTIGMPFARGLLARTGDLQLTDPAGKPVDLQVYQRSRWPDGSVAWAVLDFLATTRTGASPARYTLQTQSSDEASLKGDSPIFVETKIGTVPGRPAPLPLAELQPSGQGWVVRTQPYSIAVGTRPGSLFLLQKGGIQTPLALELTTGDGTVWTCGRPDPAGVAMEVNGPLRAVLKFSGPMVAADGTKAWRYLARLTLNKGHAALGLDISLCNDQAEPTFRQVRSWVLRLPVGGQDVRAAMERGPLEPLHIGQQVRLLQDKDDHCVLRTPVGTREQSHATGLARAAGATRQWTVVMPQFWQTYPAGFRVAPEALDVELLPRLAPDTYSDADSRKLFHRLYAWFQQGAYRFRAGQLLRRRLFIIPQALSDAEAARQEAWCSQPLLPTAPPEYLCGTGALGRKLFVPESNVWEDYEGMFARNFRRYMANRRQSHTYGFMHFGDWFGERSFNYGNNEYDVAWALAVQWMRTGRRDYFDRGLEMARHYSSIDTLYGDFTEHQNGLVWEHSFGHVGTDLTPEQVQLPTDDPNVQEYLEDYERSLFRGEVDPKGHIFEGGNWLCAALSGDDFIWQAAQRVCTNQAAFLTEEFDFGIARGAGWPLINAAAAYRQTGNPYYLNAARLMVQRILERQDPDTGGWYYYMPLNETDGVALRGCKPFTVGILTDGLLRYLDQEPRPRPDVRQALLRTADWLSHAAWAPEGGLRNATIEPPPPTYNQTGEYGHANLLNTEVVAFAYEQTHRQQYLDFWRAMMKGVLENNIMGIGKDFAVSVHQTIFGLDRIRPWMTSLPPAAKPKKSGKIKGKEGE